MRLPTIQEARAAETAWRDKEEAKRQEWRSKIVDDIKLSIYLDLQKQYKAKEQSITDEA